MWRRTLAVLPGVGVSLLPKLACPMCWPAYAGLLSTFGLGFLVSTTYLLPLTAFLLAIAVAALAYRSNRRRGHWPVLLGVVAACGIIGGKFWLESDALSYSGVIVLTGASLWNSWAPSPRIAENDLIQISGEEKRR
jgi:mercuric ion transport protein